MGPDDDYTGAAVANFRQSIEAGKQVLWPSRFRFEQDNIRRRRGPIGYGGGGHATHLDFHVRLTQPPILAGGLNRGRSLDRLTEGLDGYARRGSNMLLTSRRFCGLAFLARGLQGGFYHLPTSLILPSSVFAKVVEVTSPLRYLSRTMLRRAEEAGVSPRGCTKSADVGHRGKIRWVEHQDCNRADFRHKPGQMRDPDLRP